MSNGDENICGLVRGIVTNSGVLEKEAEIQHATKFQLKSGSHKAGIVVYNTGRIVVEGADSDLKSWCNKVKKSIEEGSGTPGMLLPAEIEKFPQTLQERVPACDGVIFWFYQEALRCYKAGSPAGAAFMLGAASEKAILILIESYAARIADDGNRDKFLGRVNNRMISVKFDEFNRIGVRLELSTA